VRDFCARQRGIRIDFKGNRDQGQYKNDDQGFHGPLLAAELGRISQRSRRKMEVSLLDRADHFLAAALVTVNGVKRNRPPGYEAGGLRRLSPQPPRMRGQPLAVPLPGRSATPFHKWPLVNSSRMKASATVCIRGEGSWAWLGHDAVSAGSASGPTPRLGKPSSPLGRGLGAAGGFRTRTCPGCAILHKCDQPSGWGFSLAQRSVDLSRNSGRRHDLVFGRPAGAFVGPWLGSRASR
jgi:hypothetical protein